MAMPPFPNILQVLMHSIRQRDDDIRIHASLMFRSIDAGCACDNDPAPTNPLTEYREHITLCD